MKLITLVTLLFASTVWAAGSHPEWDNLSELYGQRVNSPKFTAFAKQHDLKKSQKFDEGSFTPKHHAFSILFRSNQVDCIILHVADWTWGDEGWIPYDQPLPFGLVKTDTIAQVTAKHGKPDKHMWFVKKFKVLPHFDKKTGHISEIYIWKKKKETPTKPSTATE
jgi:hypothetical protein